MFNGLEENLKNVIINNGGDVTDKCIWEYPNIIDDMFKNTINNINILAGDGIEIIKDDNGNYIISSKPTAENIHIDTIDAPEYSGISTWPEGTILQNILEDLFYKVLPKVPSVTKGDVIITDENGNDRFAPESSTYIDSLTPNTKYLRLFLVSQVDPIYISLQGLELGNENENNDITTYKFINTDSIKFDVVKQDNVFYVKADINTDIEENILNNVIDKLPVISDDIINNIENN